MSCPVDLSKCFTQNDYTQFLHKSARSIVPMFYEVRDRSGDIKGYLLGTCHNLTAINRNFDDAPDILGQNSKVQKCFKLAKTLATEDVLTEELVLSLREPSRIDKFRQTVSHFQSMDAWFLLEAFLDGKKSVALERSEENGMRMGGLCVSETRKFYSTLDPTTQEKCLKIRFSRIVSGLDKSNKWVDQNCKSAEMKQIEAERNQHMALRIDALARKPDIFFAAIGSAHLAGNNNIRELLSKKYGWDVQRIFEYHHQ